MSEHKQTVVLVHFPGVMVSNPDAVAATIRTVVNAVSLAPASV